MREIFKFKEKALCLLLSAALLMAGTAGVFAGESASKVSGCSSWAKTEVSEAISEGLVPEGLQGNYQQNITRQELAELLAYYLLWHEPNGADLDKMWQHLTVKYGEDGGGNTASKAEYKENVFSDTNDVILNHLYQFGIIKGFEDGTYRPAQPISRQDAAAVLWNGAANYITGYKTEGLVITTASNTWKDFSKIGSWAVVPAANLRVYGCMKGIAEDLFGPGELITREQAIIISLRMTKAETVNLYSEREKHSIFSYSREEAMDLFDKVMVTDLNTGKSKEITDRESLSEVIKALQSVRGDVAGWKPDHPNSGYSIRLHQKYHADEDYLIGPSGYEPYGFVADAETGGRIYYEYFEMQAYSGQGIDISWLKGLL